MLVFDPQARANCVDSLEHNYVAEYHNLAYEPIAEKFDWAFSDADMPVLAWQVAIKSEIAGASVSSVCGSDVALMPAMTEFHITHPAQVPN